MMHGPADDWDARLLGTAPTATAAALRLLRRPAQELLALGTDDRARPVDGLNSYRLPLLDRPLLAGSSCTATAPDAAAVEVAGRWAAGLAARVSRTGLPSPDVLRAGLVPRLGPLLLGARLDDRRVVLTPSGTDAEALVTALALAGSDRPLLVLLVGAAEAGSGTELSAGGRHFRGRAAFRPQVAQGQPLAGFDVDRVRLLDVAVRDARGRTRAESDVEAEVEAHLVDAIERGQRVLVHPMAGSKSGLRMLGPEWVRRWRQAYPDRIRVLVDAAQARVSRGRLRAFLDAGAAVLVTGSKFLSAPPFCGVVLLSDALLGDARAADAGGVRLPTGLADHLAAADLPPGLRSLVAGPLQPANLGLLARWEIAVWEAEQLRSLPRPDREAFAERFLTAFGLRLENSVAVRVPPQATPTLLTFSLLDDAGVPLGREDHAAVYAEVMATTGVRLGQPVELARGGPAVLRVAVGAQLLNRAVADEAEPQVAGAALAARAVDALVPVLREVVRV